MTKEIKLSKGYVALVDDIDYEWLSQWTWQVSIKAHTNYARHHSGKRGKSYFGKKTFAMHRVIMNAPDGMDVDHINGNGLDNRRANLRICTRVENLRNKSKKKSNKSGYKGVCFTRNKYQASIKVDGKDIYLGLHETVEDAARTYDKFAKQYFGEFAKLNFE